MSDEAEAVPAPAAGPATPAPVVPIAKKVDRNTITYARRRVLKADAGIKEVRLRQATGQLVSKAQVERWYSERIVTVRDQLLAVPSKIKSRFADLDGVVLRELDQLIRQTLEELASGKRPPSGNRGA